MTFLLTETWLDPSIADGELLNLDDFTIIRRDRQGIGGGVLMAIPSQFCVNRRTDLEHPDLEGLFVEYHLPRGPILVCCVYCPPSSREQSYRLLDRSLQSASQKNYTNILVFGDFNCHVDWLTHDDPIPCDCADDTLLDAVTTAGFAQVCSEPTYTTRSGASSYLDLVFTPDPTRVMSCEVSHGLPGSDHRAIELAYAVTVPRRGYFARKLWRYDQADLGHLAMLAHIAPWCMTSGGGDKLANYDLWCDFAAAIQRDSVPCATKSTKRKHSPWITRDILKAARLKRTLFKKAARTKCPATLQLAKDQQRRVKTSIYVAHQKYVQGIARKAKDDPKVFWSYISRVRTTSQRPCFAHQNHVTDKPLEIAKLFADQFSSVNARLTSDCLNGSELDDHPQLHMHSGSQTGLSSIAFSSESLREAISKIRPTQGALRTLYTAMVLPTLEYCCSVWSPSQQHLVDRIESIQRKASRTICYRVGGNAFGPDTTYSDRLKTLGWRPLRHRRQVSRVSLACRVLDGSLTGSYLTTVVRVGRRTGQPEELRGRTMRHISSTLPAAIREFLRLPPNVRNPLPTNRTDSKELSKVYGATLASS
ncbi:hypothetical protein ISCGN_007491 [Ixodes scapularis]